MSRSSRNSTTRRVVDLRGLLHRLARGEDPDHVLKTIVKVIVDDLGARGAVVHALRHGHLVTRAEAGGRLSPPQGAGDGELLTRALVGPTGIAGTLTGVFGSAPPDAVRESIETLASVAEVALTFAGGGERGRERRLGVAAMLRKVARVGGGGDARPALQSLVEDAARLAGAERLLALERAHEGYVAVAGVGVPLDVLRADVLDPSGFKVGGVGPRPGDPLIVRVGDEEPAAVELVGGPNAVLAVPMHEPHRGVLVARWPDGAIADDIDLAIVEALADVVALRFAIDDHGEHLEVERERSTFLSTLSHELRTPLAVVKGALETLQAHGDELDRGMRDLLLQRMRHRVDQEVELIDTLLSLSRLDEGGFRVRREPFDLVALARTVAGNHMEVSGRLVRVNGPADAPILADRVALRQVLANLVSNALKFSRGAVDVTLSRRPRAWRVDVDDDGEGVPQSLRERVFERFVQFEHRAFETRGVGVGLSVVRGFVELHGGRVGVSNSPAGGARFWFEVPDA